MSTIGYENTRISTIRSTWVILAITLVLTGGITALAASFANLDPATGERGAPVAMSQVMNTISSPIVLVGLSAMAAMAFGGEYRFGLIRLTLTSFPRRTSVFGAKLLVVVVWLLAFLLLSAVVMVGVSALFRDSVIFEPFSTSTLGALLRSLLFGLAFCLFAFAFVLITRNQALSIIIPLLWALLVEQLLTGFLGSKYEWLPKVLPMTSGQGFINGEDMIRNGAVYFGTLAVLLLIGWALLSRRDA